MASGFHLTFSIEGEQELSRTLIGMQNNLQDFTTPFKQTADYLRKLFSTEVFTTEGGVIDERWARLSPYTVAQKARQGYGDKGILVRTGAMQQSFTAETNPMYCVISNSADYFKYHQSNQPRHRIPRRVMMKLAENQKQQIVKYFQAFIRAHVVKA